jgi:hypothetical protein
MSHVRMVNNIHDALVFDVRNEIDPNELREVLRPCVEWEIPKFPKLVADWEIGQRWGSSTKWKNDEVASFEDGCWQVLKGESLVKETTPQVDPPIEIPDPAPEPARLMVEVGGMPTPEGWGNFLSYVREHPGNAVITLKTPDGELAMEQTPTSITPADAGRVSLMLGGAQVYYPAEVDTDALSEGLTL